MGGTSNVHLGLLAVLRRLHATPARCRDPFPLVALPLHLLQRLRLDPLVGREKCVEPEDKIVVPFEEVRHLFDHTRGVDSLGRQWREREREREREGERDAERGRERRGAEEWQV